ncbi:hypothetical protein BBG47_24425 [Paenibacillus sp. KS1]|uniref:hypothetical protein n=1 Tax=Paenibacillus sp. KS1 TaxID=1849249 RepID=UPI000806466A|nr:hypothetical protein [Paenibacillus sp. KS1]OBY76918.1 hypothetical protein BBG47_24425 [Paenibacillus sp. KS1]
MMRKIIILLIISTIITACGNKTYTNVNSMIQTELKLNASAIVTTIEVEGGFISFFERDPHNDIGVVLYSGTEGHIKFRGNGGFLDTTDNWHFTAGKIAEKPYSIYYGILPNSSNKNVNLVLQKSNLSKKVTLVNLPSSKTMWFAIFDGRVEDTNVSLKNS